MSEYWTACERGSGEGIHELWASLTVALSSEQFAGFSDLCVGACVLRLVSFSDSTSDSGWARDSDWWLLSRSAAGLLSVRSNQSALFAGPAPGICPPTRSIWRRAIYSLGNSWHHLRKNAIGDWLLTDSLPFARSDACTKMISSGVVIDRMNTDTQSKK